MGKSSIPSRNWKWGDTNYENIQVLIVNKIYIDIRRNRKNTSMEKWKQLIRNRLFAGFFESMR